jgi:hypothetical protein
MVRRSIISEILIFTLFLGATGCSPVQSSPPTLTPLPPTASAPTVTPNPTNTPTIEPTKVLKAADLVPMHKIGNTSSLQEADIYPGLDIMTDAEQQMRDSGFGVELDKLTEELLTYAGRNIREHTFFPKYALNTSLEKPVYLIFLFDQTCGCFLYPSYNAENGTDSLSLTKLTVPAGISEGVEIRFIPTKTGIVPGAFYNNSTLLGWYDFDYMQWHLVQNVRNYLESLYAIHNSQAELEENLENWLSGETFIPASDLFEKSAGRPLNLNYYDQGFSFGSRGEVTYYGVLLGMSVNEEDLYVFFGFEDVSSTRYYLPFNLGKLLDEKCLNSFGTTDSNLGKLHYNLDQYTLYQCDTLRLVLGNFLNKPIMFRQITGKWGDIPWLPASSEDDFKAQETYALSMAKYIYNSSFSPIGSNTFDGRINPTPDSVTSITYPKSFLFQFVAQK